MTKKPISDPSLLRNSLTSRNPIKQEKQLKKLRRLNNKKGIRGKIKTKKPVDEVK